MPGKHMKPSGYKMKYQGSQSAFPFKSPMKESGSLDAEGVKVGEDLVKEMEALGIPTRGKRYTFGEMRNLIKDAKSKQN